MADGHHPPLNYEASATTTHPHISNNLPPEVATCLKNARFVRWKSMLSLSAIMLLMLLSIAAPCYNLDACLLERPPSPRLPNELHLPPVVTILLPPHHNNDHQRPIPQNPQPPL